MRRSLSCRISSLVISLSLILQQAGFAQMAGQFNLTDHFSGLSGAIRADKFRPVHLRYFSYDNLTDNFKLLLEKGDALKNLNPEKEAKELLKYFLTGVSLLDDMFWVNLRPDSENQVIDSWLEKTDVGRIMLEADLQLKKDTAAFTSPQTKEGREYWNKLYKKAEELYGYETVDIPTLTRPWIVPGEIIVREAKDSAYVYKATLKVMLEEDYLRSSIHQNIVGTGLSPVHYEFKDAKSKELNRYSTQLIKELIIPKLTREINSSKRYAGLRQVYYSLILSRWFKMRFSGKSGTYASLINSRNLKNLASQQAWSKTSYFKQYQKSFTGGEYSIKEPVRTPTGQVIRSYFSGGIQIGSSAIVNNGLSAKTDIPEALLSRPGSVLIQGKTGISGLEMSVSASRINNRSRVSAKLKEIKDNSGLPISTDIREVPEGVSDNILWSKALGVLYFDEDVYRRVETVDITDQDNRVIEGEITTGILVDDKDNRGSKINELRRQYDVRTGPYKSIRIGSDLQPKVTKEGKKTEGFLRDKNAEVTPEVYFMHRGVFAERYHILKAFYGENKLRFDITVIPPAVWGKEYAKTVGHYHFSQEYVKRIGNPKAVADYPEVYQVVSGEVLWLMQKCKINEKTIKDKVEAVRQKGATQEEIDKTEVEAIQAELDRGEIEDFIAVRAKAGDIIIMLPGYGHVSVNISETEPLVMADWLTWHQKSYYGSFEKKSGAAYYVIKNDQGQPELVLNPKYARPQRTRQMAVKDNIAPFGLTRGTPIYNLLNLDNKESSQKTSFLYHPESFSADLTPEKTLNDIKSAEQIPVSSTVEAETGQDDKVSSGVRSAPIVDVNTIPNFEELEEKMYSFKEKIDGVMIKVNPAFVQAMKQPGAESVAKEYDFREKKEVFWPVLAAYLQALAKLAAKREGNNKKVTILSDQEDYNGQARDSAVEIFKKAGFTIYSKRTPVTAPTAYRIQRFYGCDNILYFSASHNPYGEMGLKTGIVLGTTFGPYGTRLVYEEALKGEEIIADKEGEVIEIDLDKIFAYYWASIQKMGIEIKHPEKFHVLVDPIYGTAGEIVSYLLKKAGISYDTYRAELRSSRDIRYKGKQEDPNPESRWSKEDVKEQLEELSSKPEHSGKTVFVVVDDRDGDRQIDGSKEVILDVTSDKLGVLAMRQLVKNYRRIHKLSDEVKVYIVIDGKCSHLVLDDKELKELNVIIFLTKTGHSYVKIHLQELVRQGLLAVGTFELSGHSFSVDADGNVIEDPMVFTLARLQYLEENKLTYEQAFETLAPYYVGPSIKNYLERVDYKKGLQKRKYEIMRDAAKRLSKMIGQEVTFLDGSKAKISRVLVWDRVTEDNIKVYFDDAQGNFIGSVVFRPSANEQLSGENDDAWIDLPLGKVQGRKLAISYAKNMHLFITLFAAAYYPEFRNLWYDAKRKFGPRDTKELEFTPEEARRFALANGWEKPYDVQEIWRWYDERSRYTNYAVLVYPDTKNTVEVPLGKSKLAGEILPVAYPKTYVAPELLRGNPREALSKYGSQSKFSSFIEQVQNTTEAIHDEDYDVQTSTFGGSGLISSSLQSAPKDMGAIDFRAMNINYQAMGSFKALDLKLPQLSRAELERINIDSEIQQIKRMVSSGISPSGRRIIELTSACEQKGKMSAYSRDLLLCVVDAFELEELTGDKSSADAQRALVFVDSRS